MKNFNLSEGITVPDLTGIHQCYEVRPRGDAFTFTANIGADLIRPFAEAFCGGLDEPCFFILEVPTNEKVEAELQAEGSGSFHRDVYYMDGLSKTAVLDLLEDYGDLLIGDGMTCFGFASHGSGDELYFGEYKIANIFTSDEARYRRLFSGFKIPEEEQIKTVWDNFTDDFPGERRSIQKDGIDIYTAIERLEAGGLYFAARREG